MKLEMAMAGAVFGASCVALCAILRRAGRHASHRQQATERQLAALSATVKALQHRVEELSRAMPPAREVESIAAAAEGAGITELAAPKPETLAVITAAATAFLGKAARIRSAHLVPAAEEQVSQWSQQGRVIVQTSHNLRTRE